jgi:2-oxoglutarate ferredoxin oxidoreductase subunit alpha
MRFVMHAGHGEFPRIVLASGDIKECFYDAAQAFNYAEQYQLPVIHLVDKAMANSSQTYQIFDTAQFKVERGDVLEEAQIQTDPFKRFRFTESGVSSRVFLGTKNSVHWCTGDEHDEIGHIDEEPLNRDLMMEKRMKKLETVDKETPLEERINFFGSKNSKNMIVSWGSPKGAILEAVSLLNKEGFSLAFIQVRMLLPFPKEYITNTLKSAQRIIDVENNYLGQLGGVIKEETGISPHYYILKYNGRPMTATEIYDALKSILLGQASERQVLKYGS